MELSLRGEGGGEKLSNLSLQLSPIQLSPRIFIYLQAGRQRYAEAKTIHGSETREVRTERSLASSRLAVLEAVGHNLGFMNGTKTRGRKPDRIAEAYPELQDLIKVHFQIMKTG